MPARRQRRLRALLREGVSLESKAAVRQPSSAKLATSRQCLIRPPGPLWWSFSEAGSRCTRSAKLTRIGSTYFSNISSEKPRLARMRVTNSGCSRNIRSRPRLRAGKPSWNGGYLS
ncbi:hypothetical protein FQZ97_722830 [compost metagenome]